MDDVVRTVRDLASIEAFIADVADWHRQTFPNPSRAATARKILEETAELYCAQRDMTKTLPECADVIIAALALAVQEASPLEIEAALRTRLRSINRRGPEEQYRRDVERGIYGP